MRRCSLTLLTCRCSLDAAHLIGRRADRAKPAAELGPTVRLPPHDATRSAMPASPKPDPDLAGGSGRRGPESATDSVTKPGSYATVTRAWTASAWRSVLVSASCTIRNAVSSMPGASAAGVPVT